MFQLGCLKTTQSSCRGICRKIDTVERARNAELRNCVLKWLYDRVRFCRAILFLIVVLKMSVIRVHAQDVAPANGNVDALKAVADAWTQNQLTLRTWEGKASRTWTCIGSNELYESVYEVEFSWQRQQNRLLYVGTRERFDTSGGKRAPDDTKSGMIGGSRTADSYMQVFRSKVEQAANKRKMQVIQPPGDERPGWGSLDFNPIVLMQLDTDPVDIELGLDIKDYVYAKGVGFEIEEVGTLIHFKHKTGNREFRKTFDLSKGGNPLFYRYESTEPGAALTIQITTSYHEVGGVWIPESADYMRQDISDRYDSRVTIIDDHVNEDLSDDRFSMQRLGFLPGDRIWDKRIKAAYTYQPEEVPVAESAVKVDAVPEPNEPSPAKPATSEPALAAVDGSKPAISSSALPADPNAVPQLRRLPWWKNYAVIAIAIVFGSLGALLFLRARRPSPSSPPSEQSQI